VCVCVYIHTFLYICIYLHIYKVPGPAPSSCQIERGRALKHSSATGNRLACISVRECTHTHTFFFVGLAMTDAATFQYTRECSLINLTLEN
jgi:hypothetical protein